MDHEHLSGEIKGLLCLNCNQALGRLIESKIIINNLLTYLNKYDRKKPLGTRL